jgi:hypothetical protein
MHGSGNSSLVVLLELRETEEKNMDFCWQNVLFKSRANIALCHKSVFYKKLYLKGFQVH